MVRIPQLTELAVADFGNGDYMVIYDSDTGVTTKLTKANLIQSLVGTFGSSVSGTLVGGKAVVSTGVGTLGESSVTTTELGYVGGATAAIQTQINALSVATGVSYTPTTATQNTIQPGNATSPNLTLQMLAGQTAAPLRITSSAGTLLLSSGTNGQLISALTTGTSPLSVASTTVVANLNADLLDGNEATAFAAASHTHGMSSLTGDTFTAGQLIGGTGAGGLLTKVNAGTAGQCLGWTTGGAFTAITPSGGSASLTGLQTRLFHAPAESWRGVGTNIPEADIPSVAGMSSSSYCLAFDSATTETAQRMIGRLPTDAGWANASVSLLLSGHAYSATSGTCQWVLAAKQYLTGAWTGAFTDFCTIAGTVPGNTGSAYTGSYLASTSTLGWSAGATLELQLRRLTTGAATHAADAMFHTLDSYRVEA